MRSALLIASYFLLFSKIIFGQDTLKQTSIAENILTASSASKEILVDVDNPAELEFALKKIHTFKNAGSVILEGKAEKEVIEKLILRLSVLKNLRALTFKNNDLDFVPENITTLQALQTFTIEGSRDLDYEKLCLVLSKTSLTELHLASNDLKKTPPGLSKIKTLQKIEITDNENLNYEELIDRLAALPSLTKLAIPVNFITELPKNITKLTSLQLLDVSNNVLTDFPNEVSSLKAINNLSIQGNLLLNPVKEMEKFQGNEIHYLAVDKELSGEEVEQIKKIFPKAEIAFPSEKEENESAESNNNTITDDSPGKKKIYSGELKAKKISTILSTAYLAYPAIYQGVRYNFDTLNFEERYLDFRYSNIYQKVRNRFWSAGDFYFRKPFFNHKASRGKRSETWFLFTNDNYSLSINYPELRAFYSLYWVYQGDLTKHQFQKKFLRTRKRAANLSELIFGKRIMWNDMRIEYDKNNSLFTISVKGDTSFQKFSAYPVYPRTTLEACQQSYNRRFIMYQKTLLQRSQKFQRDQKRNKRNYDSNYRKMKTYAWNELQLRMSDEEKMMSEDEWLEYYDKVVANEKNAIDNSPLALSFVIRGMALRGYNLTAQNNSSPITNRNSSGSVRNRYGYKIFNVDFVDEKGGGNLPVTTVIVIDNQGKVVSQTAGTLGLLPNQIVMKQYAPYTLLLELRNGNFGVVTFDEISKQTSDPNKIAQLKVKIFDKNLDTIGALFKGSGL